MSIDHKKIHAAASASFCVRTCLAPALLCCGLFAVLPAQAHEQDGNRRDEQRSGQSTQAQRQQDMRAEQQRQLEQRSFEMRAEEQRRIMRENSRAAEMTGRTMDLNGRTMELSTQSTGQASGRGGRMTADERRDLRRQINEAGQDVYALPPRR